LLKIASPDIGSLPYDILLASDQLILGLAGSSLNLATQFLRNSRLSIRQAVPDLP